MPLQIYNSLKKEKEPFQPLKPPKINIYTCGVTVYNECHIGHARSLYIFDVMRRYLEYKGYKVNFVRNITDIDDKIINRAKELKVNWQELVEKYINSYKRDLELLGIREGILDKEGQEPRATKNIPEMLEYIQGLIDKGYAYVTNTGVYFSVRKFKDYGKLSHQSIDQMLTGVRKEPDETKNDPLDFVLWKLSKPDEPKWPSPWGEGRPGWHIECSVMSQKFLKTDTLDIHAGGLDLVFPHHENEIAQAEALTGKPFAKYWIHHGLLTINGQKMAKSLGNFITIQDVLSKYPVDVLKIFYLQAHYSSAIDFSWKKTEEAKERYKSFVQLFCYFKELSQGISGKLRPKDKKEIDSSRAEFEQSMDDDFNTPKALVVLEQLKSYAFSWLANFGISKNFSKVKYTIETISELINVLGLSPNQIELSDERLKTSHTKELENTIKESIKDTQLIQDYIDKRTEFKKQKKYKEADEIRNILKQEGIILEDLESGKTVWRWG